jgi:prepilin-type N-terminal cleavage/methylation domain-containing protein
MKMITRRGYTLLEVLLAIAILAILFSITLIAINPFRQFAQARNSTRQADLQSIDESLTRYLADNGVFPTEITTVLTETQICAGGASASSCTSNGYVDLESILVPNYLDSIPQDPNVTGDGSGYFLAFVDEDVYLRADETEILAEDIAIGQPPATTLVCPAGYILIPGDPTYNTNDFCVMKYEAKDSGDGQTAASVAAGLPWVDIPYVRADAGITTPAACQNAGAELMSNAEWMTIARNLEQVDANWTGGSVGNEMLYRGHSEATPAVLLAADSNDTNGTFGLTGSPNTPGFSQDYRRRTMELSTGDIIWDFAGNAREGLDTRIDGEDKPAGDALNWVDWNDVLNYGSFLPQNLAPSNLSWDIVNQGVGAYFEGDTVNDREYYIYRGGYWSDFERSGIYYAAMDYQTINYGDTVGFRCVIQ